MGHKREFDIVIVGGLGHVGLPLGLSFANEGLKVCLYDVNKKSASLVRKGKMPFVEYGAEEILKKVLKSKNFKISAKLSDLSKAKYIIISLGTPVDEYLGPKTRPFLDIITGLKPYLDNRQIIIVRSTVYPRTCQKIAQFLGEEDGPWHIAYCPERIVQGYAIKELKQLPQLVAGVTKEAEEESEKLFGKLSPKVLRVSVDEAELAKLYANAWRYIEFAIANQFYMIAHKYNVDFNRLRNIIKDGYHRLENLPGAGFAAGPCLLKDTMQLAGTANNNFFLGQAAMMVNEGLPNFVIEELRIQHDLSQKCVGILGMAFKANVDDTRDSLSFKIKNILQFYGAKVLCSDEFIDEPKYATKFVTKEEVIESCDIIIVGVPHSQYKGLVIPKHIDVVDLWGVVKKEGGV